VQKSVEVLSTNFVEVPLPKFKVEDLAGSTMTTDSEAGQAYYQEGNVGSLEENFNFIKC